MSEIGQLLEKWRGDCNEADAEMQRYIEAGCDDEDRIMAAYHEGARDALADAMNELRALKGADDD